MAGRMAGSNGMSSEESEDQVKEAAAASQSTSSMASVAAAAGLLQGAIPHVQSPVEHPKHPMVQSPAARPPWTTTNPSSSDESTVTCIAAGCASPVPGRTALEAHQVLMAALRRAAEGHQVLHPQGQQGAWLHKCFVATQLGIGTASWKSFKKQRASDIELDPQQQWVRLRP